MSPLSNSVTQYISIQFHNPTFNVENITNLSYYRDVNKDRKCNFVVRLKKEDILNTNMLCLYFIHLLKCSTHQLYNGHKHIPKYQKFLLSKHVIMC